MIKYSIHLTEDQHYNVCFSNQYILVAYLLHKNMPSNPLFSMDIYDNPIQKNRSKLGLEARFEAPR